MFRYIHILWMKRMMLFILMSSYLIYITEIILGIQVGYIIPEAGIVLPL